MNESKASFIRPLRFLSAVAVLLLGTTPAVVMSQGSPVDPPVTLIPMPQSLTFTQAQPNDVPVDPRAAELPSRLEAALQALQSSPTSGNLAVGRPHSMIRVPSGQAAPASRKAFRPATVGTPITLVAPSGAPSKTYSPRMRRTGTIRSLAAAPGEVLQTRIARKAAAASDEATVRAFFRKQRAILAISNPDQELRLRSRKTDRIGHRHLRFGQVFRNIPVWKSEIIAQVDRAGNLITISGAYASTPRKLVTKPVISSSQAGQIAVGEMAESGESVRGHRLVIFPESGGKLSLAWEIQLRNGPLEAWLVLVDAHDGSVLQSFDLVWTDNVAGSGIDLFGQMRSLNVWDDGGTHYMIDASKAMFDPTSTPPQPTLSRGVVMVQDAVNQPATSDPQTLPVLEQITSTDSSGPWLPDAVSAAHNLSVTFDYFLAAHQRNSLDNMGGNLVAVVRVGQGWQNASFSAATQTMHFGDALPYAGSLDIIAHELTHGVISHTANLVYQGQSGALNEAFADIFAETVEASVNGQPDWLIGSNLGIPLRDLADPGSMSCVLAPCPAQMSDYIVTSEDHGGVHLNSSIINHAYYLLAEGLPDAIGITDAAQIFYRALTTKLSARSQFVDARFAAIQSAEELFGATSVQATVTAEAFDAVEIYDTPANPQPAPFPGSQGQDATLFLYWDSAGSRYLLGRKDPSLSDPPQGIQLSLDAVNPGRVSVSGDGLMAVFVNSQQDMCFIATDASSPETCLGFPGSVSSVAMAPDGETFGFVFLDSSGDPDNRISVIDVDTGESQTFELVAPVFDGTTNVEVLAADAMDFTADNRFLVYDAFNELQFGDGSALGLWSIYAIDLLTGATIAVVPPTGGFEIAFPSIAQTSDSHLVFDVFDTALGQNFIVAGDVHTGETAIIDTTSDYSIPGYTGDDSGVVYSVPDGATPTGFSLLHRAVSSDRITPTGSPSLWLADADRGTVYRRGGFSGPARVDLVVTQSTSTQAGHRAVFEVQIQNNGPDAATDIALTDTLPSDVTVLDVTADTGNCNASDVSVTCSVAEVAAGVTESISIELRADTIVPLTNAATAFASQTDLDVEDNTAFARVDSVNLNISPSSTSISNQNAIQGVGFTLNVSPNFSDDDGDALTFVATGLPVTFSIDSVSGTISGTPDAQDVSSSPYSVEVTASDFAGAAASETFNLSINAAPSTPEDGDDSSGGGGGGGGSVHLAFPLVLIWYLLRARRQPILRYQG